MPDEKAVSAVAYLKAAVAYYKSLGVSVARVMTDNGSCYKSFAFARACRGLKIKHIRTKPYTLKTNCKAERFIQTALRESGEQISMIAKLSALLFFALLIAIAVVVFGRLSKQLVFDFRATVLSVILAILALIYLYWKSRPA